MLFNYYYLFNHQLKEKSSHVYVTFWEEMNGEKKFRLESNRLNLQLYVVKQLLTLESFQLLVIDWKKDNVFDRSA